jgi:rfaE bifunctional protein kinase chain/domain
VVERISPEAPVPVLEHRHLTYRPGGAANVALNISKLGAKSSLAGLVGIDSYADILKKELETCGIDTALMLGDESRPTSLKTRIIAQQQQLLRIDQEKKTPLEGKTSETFFKQLDESSFSFDAMIVSDYGKGLIHAESFPKILAYRKKHPVLTVLDPKKNYSIYAGVDAMTHNHHEAAEDTQLPCDTDDQVKKVGEALIRKHGLSRTLITRGAKGMALFSKKTADEIEMILVPTYARAVFDVSGAGDTVISVFTLAMAANATALEAALLANHAAGVVVSKFGTATASAEEILEEMKAH